MTEVAQNERLTRYLLDRTTIRSDGNLHWRALTPNKDGETSVYRTDGWLYDQTKDVGVEEVARPQGKAIVGWADFIAQVVYTVSLKIRPDRDPLSRHADIINWPAEKDRHKSIAIDLAAEATVKRL